MELVLYLVVAWIMLLCFLYAVAKTLKLRVWKVFAVFFAIHIFMAFARVLVPYLLV